MKSKTANKENNHFVVQSKAKQSKRKDKTMSQNILINRKELVNVKRFGVELEVFGVSKTLLQQALSLKGINSTIESYNHVTRNHWKITTDISIRDNAGRNHAAGGKTLELVSPILNGMEGMKELRKVCQTLEFVEAKVNKTCGLHVHHEWIDATTKQKNNLLKFYARLERTIDAFTPKSRKRNKNRQYCQSMVDAYESNLNYNQTIDNAQFNRKYYKLNFANLDYRNTLEFRHHAGTIDFEKIYHWTVFTANFLHNCKDKTSRTSMNFIERAWTPKHLKLSKRTWSFFKDRMKKLDDLPRETQNVKACCNNLLSLYDYGLSESRSTSYLFDEILNW